MPARAAVSTVARTAFAPSTWPAVRGRPRWVAQRPLPSMMIATCMASSAPGCLDNGLDMLEVAQQCPLSDRCNAVLGLRSSVLEGLRAHHIARFFELASVRAQVAVAHVEQGLELVEAQLLVHGKGTHDAEPHPLVDEAVESRILAHNPGANGRRRLRGRFAGSRSGRLAALDGAGFSRHESNARSGGRRAGADRRTP